MKKRIKFIATLMATVFVFSGVITPNGISQVYASETPVAVNPAPTTPALASTYVITDAEVANYYAAFDYCQLLTDQYGPYNIPSEYWQYSNFAEAMDKEARANIVNTHEIMALECLLVQDHIAIPGEIYDIGTLIINSPHSKADLNRMYNFLLNQCQIFFERGAAPDYVGDYKEFVARYFPSALAVNAGPWMIGSNRFLNSSGEWEYFDIAPYSNIPNTKGEHTLLHTTHFYWKGEEVRAVYYKMKVIINTDQLGY